MLQACGPFEQHPHLAVALSGGNDSFTLTLLALNWVRRHQGQLTALIIDHQLNPAAEDPVNLQDQLKTLDIPSVVLSWAGIRKSSRLQESARQARYELMLEWCQAHHVLHLLVGHHQDDQRETFLLRENRYSGDLGLAGMAAVVEKPHVRLLRPLLNMNKKDLSEYLAQHQISAFQDPSNHSLQFSRNQVRAASQKFTFLEKKILDRKIQSYGEARQEHEAQINELVARTVNVHPAGYGYFDQRCFEALPVDQAQDILKRCLMTFGVKNYPPSQESLRRCLEKCRDETVTLQGCIVFHHQQKIYIAREPYRIKPQMLNPNCLQLTWDQRFEITLSHEKEGADMPLILRALGQEGIAQLSAFTEYSHLNAYPPLIRESLPSLWAEPALLSLFKPLDKSETKFTLGKGYDIQFAPRYLLSHFTFTIVK